MGCVWLWWGVHWLWKYYCVCVWVEKCQLEEKLYDPLITGIIVWVNCWDKADCENCCRDDLFYECELGCEFR